MKESYVSRLSLGNGPISLDSEFLQGKITQNVFAEGPKTSFHEVMMNTLDSVNSTVSKPDRMMEEAVVNGTYDVHEVMMASAKAELSVTITSQVATKVVQAYDRILQIQV